MLMQVFDPNVIDESELLELADNFTLLAEYTRLIHTVLEKKRLKQEVHNTLLLLEATRKCIRPAMRPKSREFN